MSDERSQEPEYEVGYGRPPVETRFQKGQSGNPKGRPKGVRNFATVFKEVVNRKVRIQENGRTSHITVLEMAFRRMSHGAMEGDNQKLSMLLKLALQLEDESPDFSVLPQDTIALRRLLNECQDLLPAGGEDGEPD